MDIITTLELYFSQYGYFLVFFGSFLESLLFIGFVLPGGLIILLSGYIARQGELSLPIIMFLSTLGMFLGDLFNYFLGQSNWEKLFSKTRFYKTIKEKEKTANLYFQKIGISIIYYSHIIGYLRTIICFTAGFIRLPLKEYLLHILIASFLWSSLYILLGYILGSTSYGLKNFYEKIEIISLGIIIIFIGLKILEAKLKAYMENRLQKRDSKDK